MKKKMGLRTRFTVWFSAFVTVTVLLLGLSNYTHESRWLSGEQERAAGEALKRHITPVDVFFYVLEGTGVVEIGDEKQAVGKDMLVESPARIPHTWSNESKSVFRVLVVKVPKPTEETKMI